MNDMDSDRYDLWYDATSVGADLVVETWISHSPERPTPRSIWSRATG